MIFQKIKTHQKGHVQIVAGGSPALKRDWRVKKDYESLNKNTPEQWAWEFLRRNPDYCKDFERREFNGRKGAQKWGLGLWLDPDQDYPFVAFEPIGGVMAAVPSDDFPKRKGFFVSYGPGVSGDVLLKFNVLRPINPQIKIAREELIKMQQARGRKQIVKPRKSEWIMLIRIIDAVREGARPKLITDVFFPDAKTALSGSGSEERLKEISAKIKQANRYMNFDYRFIPFLSK